MKDRVKSATGIDTVIEGGGELYLKMARMLIETSEESP